MPQLDTRGLNFRQGTMAGIAARGGQVRNALNLEELQNRPEQRAREEESFEMKRRMHNKQFERLVNLMDDDQKNRLEKELKSSAMLLAGVNDAETWASAYDKMIKDKKGATLERLGLKRDGYSPETIEYLQDYVTGQQGIIEKIKAKNAAALAKQKAAASMKETKVKEAGALKRTQIAAKARKAGGVGGSAEEKAKIRDDIRSQVQSISNKIAGIEAGQDISIPGLENLSPQKAISALKKRMKKLGEAYVKNDGVIGNLGLDEGSRPDPDGIRELLFK